MTYSILIVDDDTAIKESVEEFLNILKYNVQSASDAKEALVKLQSFKADVVLTDIMMQGMDGLELTKQIKTEHNVDVMVMTGYSADDVIQRALSAGARQVLRKPFGEHELIAALQEAA